MDCPDADKPQEMAQIGAGQAKEYFLLELEAEAKIRAVKHIKGLLRKPDQIEKVKDLTLKYTSSLLIPFTHPATRIDSKNRKKESQHRCHVEHGDYTTT